MCNHYRNLKATLESIHLMQKKAAKEEKRNKKDTENKK